MKPFRAFLLMGSLVAGQSALATSMSINHFTPRVLPVLVQVDSHGKVTQVSPSVELTPRYDRLLRQSLDEMITRPANDHGRPVASQFVINLGLETTQRPDGNYDARFVYVSIRVYLPGASGLLVLGTRGWPPAGIAQPQR